MTNIEALERLKTRADPPKVHASGDSEMQAMLQEADLLSLIQADTGESGRKSGNRYDFKHCPVCGHQGCFSYYPATNSWACFSASNPTGFSGGTVLEYMKAAHGFTDVEAVKELRELTGHPYEPKNAIDRDGTKEQGGASSQLYARADATPAEEEPVRTFAEILPRVNRDRPEVIEGVLFDGGEMILQAPPKTGKSTAELWLAACASCGAEWFGHRVRKCASLYINTEGETDDFGNALADLMEYMPETNPDLIHVWNISGKTAPLDLLENALIDKATNIDGLGLILLDSVFPVITGDENSNTDMSYFTNVLQRIRLETGTALCFAHHTSKGAGQYSETMYRSSGAGVWARHPTTILDVARVKVKPEIRAARLNIEQCELIDRYLADIGCGFAFADSTRKLADEYRRACVDVLEPSQMNELIGLLDAAERRIAGCKAVRLSITRRGAQEPPPASFWFDYPLFVADRDGLLKRASDDDGTNKATKSELAQKRHAAIVAAIDEAVNVCAADGAPPTRASVLERIGLIDGKRVTIEQLKGWTRNNAEWSPWRIADDGTNELRRTY